MMKRRNTAIQEAILLVLTGSKKAMSQDAVVRQLTLSADRATVYRVLNRFCTDGTVHRIVADDGKQYFAVCIKCEDTGASLHHFHFRCTQCETIECLPESVCCVLPAGYHVQQVNCVLTGVCRDCAD